MFYLTSQAMFASSYAVRFADRVEHLVLVSPAGVGQLPPPSPQVFGIKIFRFLWNLRLTPMVSLGHCYILSPTMSDANFVLIFCEL